MVDGTSSRETLESSFFLFNASRGILTMDLFAFYVIVLEPFHDKDSIASKFTNYLSTSGRRTFDRDRDTFIELTPKFPRRFPLR